MQKNIFILFLFLVSMVVHAEEVQDYYDFIQKSEAYAEPITEETLKTQIELARVRLMLEDKQYALNLTDSNHSPVFIPPNLSREELRAAIITRLHIDFLLDYLKTNPPTVKVVSRQLFENYTEESIVISDYYVGNISILVLVPHVNDDAPLPAILIMHGHGSSPQRAKNNRYGEDLVRSGFVVVIPLFRAMDCDEEESNVSKSLLLQGFTLEGLHVYETVLVLEYLKNHSFVDAKKIGAVSHSGGSSILHLVVRLSKDVKSMIIDYPANYLNFCGENGIHDETIPRLKKYTPAINNYKTLTIPVKEVPYNYQRNGTRIEAGEILDFFKSTLEDPSKILQFARASRLLTAEFFMKNNRVIILVFFLVFLVWLYRRYSER